MKPFWRQPITAARLSSFYINKRRHWMTSDSKNKDITIVRTRPNQYRII